MNERTLLGISCDGTEIYGKLDKISVHTNSDPDCGGSSWGWLSGCSNTLAGQTTVVADSRKKTLTN